MDSLKVKPTGKKRGEKASEPGSSKQKSPLEQLSDSGSDGDDIPPGQPNQNKDMPVDETPMENSDRNAEEPERRDSIHSIVSHGTNDQGNQDDANPLDDPALNPFLCLVASIQKMANFVETEAFEQLNSGQIRVRRRRLQEQFDSLSKEHLQIVKKMDKAALEVIQGQMDRAEELFFVASAAYIAKMDSFQPEGATASPDSNKKIQVNVTVPEKNHDIPNSWGHFDGNLVHWLSFRDQFMARIHNNKDIAPSYKLSYLRKSLKGKALEALGGGRQSLTDGQYQEAWDRIYQLYNKPYKICRAYLRQWQQLPTIQGRPTADELQRLSNVTHELLRSLRSLLLPVDQWDMFIVHNLHERLDSETARQWELQRKTETPKAIDMLDFIDQQAAALSSQMVDKPQKESLTVTVGNSRGKKDGNNRPPRSRSSSAGRSNASGSGSSSRVDQASGIEKRKFPCACCASMDHAVYDCDDFLALVLAARWNFVRRRHLCPNCLKSGHTKEKCYSVKCPHPECQKADPLHNSLLCPYKVGRDQKPVLASAVVPLKRSGGKPA